MAITAKSLYMNDGRLEFEGMFNISAAGAVLPITNPDGSTKTVTGEYSSVTKTGTGLYVVVANMTSSESGPVFQPVELLNADADLIGVTLATAVGAHVVSVANDTNGRMNITIQLVNAAGAAADTTGAISVSYSAVVCTKRMGAAL